MNLIARQSIKYSILSYLGVLIGTASTIFLYPYDFAYMGDIRFFMNSATLLFPFIIMGTSNAMVRYFPAFDELEERNALLSTSVAILTGNTILLFLVFSILNYFDIIPYFINDIWENFHYILLLSYFLGLMQVGSKYISNFGRIAVPVFFDNLLPKFALIVSFCLFVFFAVEKQWSIGVFIFLIGAATFGLGMYISQFQQVAFKNPTTLFKDKKFTQEFFAFSGYSLLGGVGSLIATQVDIVMIKEMISSYQTGLYATMVSIIGLLYVPSFALGSIAGPIISTFIYNKEQEKLKKLYQKVSENLFFIGGGLLCLLLAIAPTLFSLMHKGEELMGIYTVLYFLGAAALFDLATGLNNQIISYSKYFRFHLIVSVILAFMVVFLNYFLIKNTDFGVVGVAISTFISIILYNIIKLVFIQQKFGFVPFTKKFLAIGVAIIFGLSIAIYTPNVHSIIWTTIVKCILIIVVFFALNEYLKIIPLRRLLSNSWKEAMLPKE